MTQRAKRQEIRDIMFLLLFVSFLHTFLPPLPPPPPPHNSHPTTEKTTTLIANNRRCFQEPLAPPLFTIPTTSTSSSSTSTSITTTISNNNVVHRNNNSGACLGLRQLNKFSTNNISKPYNTKNFPNYLPKTVTKNFNFDYKNAINQVQQPIPQPPKVYSIHINEFKDFVQRATGNNSSPSSLNQTPTIIAPLPPLPPPNPIKKPKSQSTRLQKKRPPPLKKPVRNRRGPKSSNTTSTAVPTDPINPTIPSDVPTDPINPTIPSVVPTNPTVPTDPINPTISSAVPTNPINPTINPVTFIPNPINNLDPSSNPNPIHPVNPNFNNLNPINNVNRNPPNPTNPIVDPTSLTNPIPPEVNPSVTHDTNEDVDVLPLLALSPLPSFPATSLCEEIESPISAYMRNFLEDSAFPSPLFSPDFAGFALLDPSPTWRDILA